MFTLGSGTELGDLAEIENRENIAPGKTKV